MLKVRKMGRQEVHQECDHWEKVHKECGLREEVHREGVLREAVTTGCCWGA